MIAAIFAWATERTRSEWLQLYAVGLIMSIIPIVRLPFADALQKLNPAIPLALALLQELVLLLVTAAMVLIVVRPPGLGAAEAAREAISDAPRLTAVKLATAAIRWLPGLAIGFLLGRAVLVIVGLLFIPVAFLCQVAYVGAVIERTGPLAAIANTYRRARLCDLHALLGMSVLVALVEQLPPLVIAWFANAIFPPASVAVPFPLPHAAQWPYPTTMTVPGRAGSGIPWGAHVVMLLLDLPFFVYATVLYAGAALSFEDLEAPVAESAAS